MTQKSRQRHITVFIGTFVIFFLSLSLFGSIIYAKGIKQQRGSNMQSVSPLIFGTNLGLFNSSDQVLTQQAAQSELLTQHIQIIRFPARTGQEATTIQAAKMIKAMGVVPLVILRGAIYANVLAEDTQVVNDMTTIFDSDSTVYYEFGNEEDMGTNYVDPTIYASVWNTVIPQLKQIAPHAHFIGPVNFQYNPGYLRTFLQNANPLPDEISWHEYTCSISDSSDTCIANIAKWSTHIQDARTLMNTILGTELPIMITEWNFDPECSDPRLNTSPFVQNWTAAAVNTLVSNGVFAAMQYAASDACTQRLLNPNNTSTEQGLTMKADYEAYFSGSGTPTPSPTGISTPTPTITPSPTNTPSPTPSPTPPPTNGFSFEDGQTDGWGARGTITLANSTTYAKDGTHSLQVNFASIGNTNYPYIAVAGSHIPTPYPQTGQTLTAYIFLPAGMLPLKAWLFMMDNNYKWYSAPSTTLSAGIWNRLTFVVPSTIITRPSQLGIQFNGTGSGSVYVDAINWN